MKRTLPKYLTAYRDRHGKVRYRFRRTGQKPYSFKSKVGSPEFLNEYHACLAGEMAPSVIAGAGRATRGSFNDLISRFYRSTEWATPSASSKKSYRSVIERFRAEHGHRIVREMRYAHVDSILAQMSGTPAAANNLRKILIRLMDYAVKLEMADRNPVRGTRPYKTNPDGWHSWTEEEIEQFKKRHPLGTKPRLAFALLLNTGQRRSDVVRMGRQHLSGGKLSVVQQKTRERLRIPVGSELSKSIAAMPPSEHLTFLVTEYGRPFTAAGFGNWFRDQCNLAGLKHCSAHGLRKAFARRAAEAGLTHSQGKALTGHRTDAEFNRYSRAANQEALAETGMANLEARLAKLKDK
jgi:integrase